MCPKTKRTKKTNDSKTFKKVQNMFKIVKKMCKQYENNVQKCATTIET